MTRKRAQRPLLIAVTGSNGAGKTTFFHAHLAPAGLRLVNADVLAREMEIDPYMASKMAGTIRQRLLEQRESFVFETVFSDPVGDKLRFLQAAATAGYEVILCFIGLASVATSDERVAMRVSQGGHDVPPDKLKARFPRTLANLKAAIQTLPRVIVFDNEDLNHPFRRVAEFNQSQAVYRAKPLPQWLAPLVPKS